MDSNLRREIIIDNYQNPTNRQKKDDKDFIVASTVSDSCIDNITLYVKFNDDVIEDIYFDGGWTGGALLFIGDVLKEHYELEKQNKDSFSKKFQILTKS